MKKKLTCIMLVDDNKYDNFFHEREIKKISLENIVFAKNSGTDALDYLKSDKDPHVDLIFLDINMPGMNGWEFLQEYDKLDHVLKSRTIIVMLTTSDNPDDLSRSKKWGAITDYVTKPLTHERMKIIIDKYFNK